MNPIHSLRRPGISLALILLIPALLHAQVDTQAADSSLEIIRYTMPAGWLKSEQPGKSACALTSPDSNATEQAIILIVLSPVQAGFDFRAAFDTAVKEVASNGKVLEPGEAVANKSRQGFDILSRTVVTQGAGDQRVFAKMTAASVQNRMAGIYFLATSQAMYDKHSPALTALLRSVSFDAAPVAAAMPVNPLAQRGELEALEKQKQELLQKVAEIEARQRQLIGPAGVATPGNSVPGTTTTPPADAKPYIGDEQQLLAKAREQYAKEVGARRKPHTVLGDILRADGKPIPDVVAYRVSVWGTTVAAEKTQYGLEVDRNGHFEQQVPDGLYLIKATCIVNHGGRHVPVDLVWLDDRKEGTHQSSAGGIVRDFRLVMNGLKPGTDPKGSDSYFGGGLSVHGPTFDLHRGHLGTRFPQASVRVTLTPLGPLVDGSRLNPLTIDFAVDELSYSSRRRSIPIGVYRATAVLIGKDGAQRPLQCSNVAGQGYANAVDIFWEGTRDYPETRKDPAIHVTD